MPSTGHLGERQEHLQPGILCLKRLQLARLGDVHLPNFPFHLQHVAALIPCLRQNLRRPAFLLHQDRDDLFLTR